MEMTRMTDERLAVLERNCEIIASKKYRGWVSEIVAALKAEREAVEAAEAKLEAVEKHNEILAAANRDYMTKLEVISQKAQKWRRRVADPLFGYPDVSARQDASAILDDIQKR